MWFALQTAESLEVARIGLTSKESDNKEMGAMQCILTELQVSAVRCSRALRRNKTVTDCGIKFEKKQKTRGKEFNLRMLYTRLYVYKFLAMSFRASLTRPLAI